MGENKHIDELDAFTKKYVKEIKIDKTPTNFTSSVMDSIIAEKSSNALKSSALISKKAWFFIAASLVTVLFISFKNNKENAISFSKFDFSFLEKFQALNLFENISISKTVFYSVFFFGCMLLCQLVFLKKYFEKQLH
ncbi:hypothetical protein FDT66_09790 [Polaribacter aestuariivivens]|uniref:Uncharacterized protein n=1 Tax=Polaribacter aestuariivivens TaxID=2304626 RepID=A0A5S3N314_9FLAO|nr:hypothetical protein [Polaribacter aestuariivivens]TMM29407.1 hypothetical protein FDT66_09790 [Polaribacter aestuariivivens]